MARLLADGVRTALDEGAAGLTALALRLPPVAQVDRADRAATLLALHELRHGALTPASRWADHPVVAGLRWELEQALLAELAGEDVPPWLHLGNGGDGGDGGDPAASADETVSLLRRLAAQDRLPAVYRWVATSATLPQLVEFLELEGGPDAGFDDLVAACQVGLSGSAKLELATNYWDEMGRGDAAGVHTTLHTRMAEALQLRRLPLEEQPVQGLERSALGGLLAGNHWLQPEMLGALGLIELQAGPRCRLVVSALRRLDAPAEALPFYEEHADVDPRHGRDWLEKAIHPLIVERPDWAPGIVRGAWWRWLVNRRFFDAVEARLCPAGSQLAAAA